MDHAEYNAKWEELDKRWEEADAATTEHQYKAKKYLRQMNEYNRQSVVPVIASVIAFLLVLVTQSTWPLLLTGAALGVLIVVFVRFLKVKHLSDKNFDEWNAVIGEMGNISAERSKLTLDYFGNDKV